MGQHSDAPSRAIAVAATRDQGRAEELDLRGEVCPYTFLKARLALETLAPGALLRVVVDNPTSARDVPRALATAGHAILACESTGDGTWAILARRAPA
jgi:tRNA 2-thiouridine synthesizing protein A